MKKYSSDIILKALTSEPQDAKSIAAKLGVTTGTARSWLKKAREAGAIPQSSITKRGATMVYVGITATKPVASKPVASKRAYSTHKRTKASLVKVITARQAKHKSRWDAAKTPWESKAHRKSYQRATKRLAALAV